MIDYEKFFDCAPAVVIHQNHELIKELDENYERSKELFSTELLKNPLIFSNPQPMQRRAIGMGNGHGTGVYRIIYQPRDEIYYVGAGILTRRKDVHIAVYRHKGKKIISYPSGAIRDSTAGRGMYHFDPSTLDNWWFQWAHCHPLVMKQFETVEIRKWSPKINSQYKLL